MNTPHGKPFSRMARAYFRMSAWFWLRTSSIHVLKCGLEKNISGGILPSGGKWFLDALRNALLRVPAPSPRAESFSKRDSNTSAPFSNLKENGSSDHTYLPFEESSSGEAWLPKSFFRRSKLFVSAGKGIMSPRVVAAPHHFSPSNGSTRVLKVSAAAQETDNINASIAPLMRNTLYSGAEAFKKNGEFARLTVKFGAGFPLFY